MHAQALRNPTILAVAIAFAVGSLGCATDPDADVDADISNAVQERFERANFVEPSNIVVQTEDRVVILTGHVSEAYEKERAAELARSVDGVAHVRNLIQLRPYDVDDPLAPPSL